MNYFTRWVAIGCLLSSSGLVACGKDDENKGDVADAGDTGTDPKGTKECPVIVSDDDCDDSLRPIVFVHGTYGSGDNIENVAALFGSNGYCQDRFVAIEYNSVPFASTKGAFSVDDLDKIVDDVLKKTGAKQVDLMGHSQGTGHCDEYLADAAHAAKVAHYVNLSGQGMVPNDVPTLSLSSENDLGGTSHHAPNAEKEVTFKEADHFGVAASQEAFVEIYKYLIGKAPKYTEIQCGDAEVTVEGIAEAFGDNDPVIDGKLEIYEMSDTPREKGKLVMSLANDGSSHIGPIKLKRNTQYEFRAIDKDDKIIGYQYFAPFKRSNRLARFLAPPTSAIVKATTTGQVVTGPDHSALVFRTLAGAFRFDLGDSLKVNGKEILTADNAALSSGQGSTPPVGFFASDQDGNGKTDLGNSFQAPFIVGTDVFIDASKPAWIEIEWKGQTMKVANWPSDQGLISLTMP